MKRYIIIMLLIAMAATAMARQPKRGYRGFLDWNNDIATERYDDDLKITNYYSGISTSHGYQFNPNIFLGVGIGVENYRSLNRYIIPAYLHLRTDQKFGIFTPFGEVRIGYNLTDGGGIYFSPAIGYRFNWGRKLGVNLGVGLTVKGNKVDIYEFSYYDGTYISQSLKRKNETKCLFAIRLGIDF